MTAHPTNDDEKQVTPPATTPRFTPTPEEENSSKAEKAETAEPETDEAGKTSATSEGTEPTTEAAPAGGTAAGTTRKSRWLSICMDALIILLIIGVLGAAYHYFRITTERYHVPTPTELLLRESEELDSRYNELLSKANHADTQLHMRARLAQLEERQAQLSALIAEKKAALDDCHSQVLAMQYSIRQADETNRGIARSLLPGMPVGNVTTTTGKAYRNATIYRLDKRYIYLRFPEGQVRFPLRHLVKDNLPELARYAFGVHDLVDMSDFEQTGDTPAPAAPQPRRSAPASVSYPADEGYDPAPGAPVLDTEANRTTTNRVPEEGNDAQDSWEAPSGELPM